MSYHRTEDHIGNKGLPFLCHSIFMCKLYFAMYAFKIELNLSYISTTCSSQTLRFVL